MTRKKIKNLPASVRQHLLNRSRRKGEDFQLTLTRYALERFLYRLGVSPHAQRFILKGAMLFLPWFGETYRPTRDVDLLGYGDFSEDELRRLIRDICRHPVEPDGVEFNVDSIRVEQIREEDEYSGLRAKLETTIEKARVILQIDVGCGDAVTPEAKEILYPTLLGFPAPRIRVYPPETVVAEKLETIVRRGMLNSRMRDYYDLKMIAGRSQFDGSTLVDAISATFDRRQTSIPDAVPVGLSDEFSKDQDKLAQWAAFLKRAGLEDNELELSRVVDELRGFLVPPLLAAARREAFEQTRPQGGPWSQVP